MAGRFGAGMPVGYRSASGVGRATVLTLWPMVVLLALMALSDVMQYLTTAGLEAGLASGSISNGTALAAGASFLGAALLAILFGVGTLVGGILFIVWMHRTHSNLPALGARGLRFTPGWAIGGWFVPILNLWRPKQIADEIYAASNPHAPAEMGVSWRQNGPRVVVLWWATWLTGGLLGQVASSMMGADPSGFGAYRTGLLLDAVSNVVLVAAGYFAITFVREVTERQERRAARLSSPTG
ncbi:MAG: DUF4328 domain-containing protein [Actinomycetota bacterium]